MYDIIIKNGEVVDGTGKPRFKADVAIKDGKVAAVAPQITKPCAETVDAKGLIVAPGFIDGHTHSDSRAVHGSDSYNHLEQGTTTQIAGQCGSSPTPYYSDAIEGVRPADDEKREAEICATPAGFMRHALTMKLGTNMAFYAGHGQLRAHAMGYSDARPTAAQMDDMKRNLVEALECGFLGYSSGLVYAPSVYADTEELIELAKVMAPYKGVYTSHIRGEGDNVEASVAEAIRVAEEGGVPLVISHLKVAGKKNIGKSVKLLQMLDDAAARGVRAYADQYPFLAGSAPLVSQIPAKFLVGGRGELLKRIKNPGIRAEIEYAIFNLSAEFESSVYQAGYEGTLIAGAPKTPQYVGMTMAELAAKQGKAPIDAFCDFLLENDAQGQGIYFSINEDDMLRIMAHPRITAGSDWSDYQTHIDPEQQAGGHPRGTATMTRRLEICRDNNLRTLEDSIRSMTALTALSVGLSDQGVLLEGRDANITIFDYEGIRSHADFLHPFRRNEGICTVIVNGEIAVREGHATGVRAGRALRRS